ncbi:JmjC domain-containing histone demethylation protein 1 [Entomortierella beljakovae]|nr:JmjC domain-containing histone demethylation protein 1 [Entomortierella beljakovae]
MTDILDSQKQEQEQEEEPEFCILCPENNPRTGTWICCDVCETWYHVRCLKMSFEEFETIDQFHCSKCKPKAGPSTLLRKSSRRTGKINYADLVNGIVSHQSKWRVLLDSHQFLPDKFERLNGNNLTLEWLRNTGFRNPVIVNRDHDGTTDGLDMKMPPAKLTVDDIRDFVGPETPVEVIDVATQSELSDWNLGSWADYFKSDHKDRVYNVISLEITGTSLAEHIQRPKVVRELDWIENFWPNELKDTEFPKVQLYCLMSVKDSFTDFHIDFAGSSVFYHILSGSKTFFFIEPTPTHLRKYAKWSSSADQATTFFGDEVAGKCYKVELNEGDTMLIPAGWIHAVYTPSSSVVIGGNFIHSLHIPMQYRVCDIEIETNVSPKFRFPFFEKLNWFVAKGCIDRGWNYLTSLSKAELRGLLALTVHLYKRQRSLKRDPTLIKEERHMIRASVPAEVTAYINSGPMGLLRDLNRVVCEILEELYSADNNRESIDCLLRVPTEEQEREEDGRALGSNKPKIKLRLKLNSTTSSTTSGDEESILGEQQVPTSAALPAPPKLKFKLPSISSIAKSSKKTQRKRKRKGALDKSLYESGSDLDDEDSSSIEDQEDRVNSDDEWTEFESQIDEGFDEIKDNDDVDDGSRVDLGSSDSEYDEGEKKSRRSTPRHRKTSSSKSITPIAKSPTTPTIARSKQFSTETVYFGDDGDGDSSSTSSSRPLKMDSDDGEEEVILGLGKKRKLTPMQFSSLLTTSAPVSFGKSTPSSSASSAARKKAVTGGTAKDRIKSLLLKRR